MYLLPYHASPKRPIPIPPNIAAKSTIATHKGAIPVKALLAASELVTQEWPSTSTIRNIRIPVANALSKPFFFRLTL
jgi:hypothetical protein